MFRTARELGALLHAAGRLPHAEAVDWLSLEELDRLVSNPRGGPVPAPPAEAGPPLPAAFRLTDSGAIAAVARPGVAADGRGAGGGRGEGPVAHGTPDRPPPEGSVLVVRTLEPELAALLPGLSGLVAETGSTLSHLAILAREYGVPTVVAVPDALERYPEGAEVLVDGGTGEVRVVEPSGPAGEPRDDGRGSDQLEEEVIT